MNKTRQDAWTKDEDIILAEIVLKHIRNGRTQLEAFKQAGEALSRTAAACGFRWNATIRKKHIDAINMAKNNRKQTILEKVATIDEDEHDTIESAISLLEKMKENVARSNKGKEEEREQKLLQLQAENTRLEKEIKRYEEAWAEMKNIWEWIGKKMNINIY